MDDDTVVVEISHFGQVSMLANVHCQSKSINAPYSPSGTEDEDDGYNSNEDVLDEGSEERKKLGAADTFRLPDDFDIAHLSWECCEYEVLHNIHVQLELNITRRTWVKEVK